MPAHMLSVCEVVVISSEIVGTKGLAFSYLLAFALLSHPNVLLCGVFGFGKQTTTENGVRALNTDQQFYDSGTGFLRTCSAVNRVQAGRQSARDIAGAHACESYVAGVADGVALQHIWSRSHGDKNVAAFCVQFEDVPAARLVDAVLQYLRENPDRKRFRAAIAVEEVLHRKFPCH